MIINIPLLTRPKKNSQQMIINQRTGRPMLIQSKQYLQFERDCAYFLKRFAKGIGTPINLKCTFYVPDKRKRDLCNLLNAIQDVLVKYNVIKDDNYNIVQSVDGSRILYEKRKRRNDNRDRGEMKMNLTKLDKFDEETSIAVRKVEKEIVSDIVWTSVTAFIIGFSIGMLISNAVRLQTVSLTTFTVIVVIAMLCSAGWLIKSTILNIRTELRKLEGVLSIHTARLVEEIDYANTKSK